MQEPFHIHKNYHWYCGGEGLSTTNDRHVTCEACNALRPRDLEAEIRSFVTFLGIENASWTDRIGKLCDEVNERDEADAIGTFDDRVSEHADVCIVNYINYLKARDELEALGVRAESAIICKIDEVRRR